MTSFGYTAMCEQTPVRQLVRDLAAVEQAGFDFSAMSDHYSRGTRNSATPATHGRCSRCRPGHAAAAADDVRHRPTFHYQPAAIAQKAATMRVLSEGRFTLVIGAGETSTGT